MMQLRSRRMTASIVLVLAVVIMSGCDSAESSPAPVVPDPSTGPRSTENVPVNAEFIRDPALVLDVAWLWVSTTTPVEQIEVNDPERYSITLRPDGTLAARFDCNRGGGDYTIGEGTLSFGPMISTRMACPPDSLDTRFMRDLGEVTSFFRRDGELYLEMPMDSGTLRFRPAR